MTRYAKDRGQRIAPQFLATGIAVTINSQSFFQTAVDVNGNITAANGTVVITDGGAGFAKGCSYVKTDAAATVQGLYINIGTDTACEFVAVGAGGGGIGPAEITFTNKSGGKLTKGELVFCAANSDGSLGMQHANYAGAPCAFIITADVLNNAQGTAASYVTLTNVDTSAASQGDLVFLGASGGYLLTNPPASTNIIQIVGQVLVSDAVVGQVFLFVGPIVAPPLSLQEAIEESVTVTSNVGTLNYLPAGLVQSVFGTAGSVTGPFVVVPSTATPSTGQVSINMSTSTLTFFAGDIVTAATVTYITQNVISAYF